MIHLFPLALFCKVGLDCTYDKYLSLTLNAELVKISSNEKPKHQLKKQVGSRHPLHKSQHAYAMDLDPFPDSFVTLKAQEFVELLEGQHWQRS